MPTVLEEEAQGAMAKDTRDPDLDGGLPTSTLVSWAMSRSSSGVTPETSMVTCSTPPDCDQRDCFVVQGKKQETNTGSKPKMADHYSCTITCAICGKRKHYEDEWYHKQSLSAKLKGEDPGKGSGKGGGKDKNDSGKSKSKGSGKGQDKSQGGRGPGADRQQDKNNKKQDKSGGYPNPSPGGNFEPSGGQSGSGPTTRSQTQAQQEQVAKRGHERGDDGQAKKRTRFMGMDRKLRNKGFQVSICMEPKWWPCQIQVLSQNSPVAARGGGARLGGALPNVRSFGPKTAIFRPKQP